MVSGSVLRPSSHSHPAAVSWRSCLSHLHHRNLGHSRHTWLPRTERLSWRADVFSVCVWLHWLAWAVWCSGVGLHRVDDDRDVDLLDSVSVWQRRRHLWSWSYGHSLENETKKRQRSWLMVRSAVVLLLALSAMLAASWVNLSTVRIWAKYQFSNMPPCWPSQYKTFQTYRHINLLFALINSPVLVPDIFRGTFVCFCLLNHLILTYESYKDEKWI